MSRIEVINKETAGPEAGEILEGVRKKMGRVPNVIATMAHAPSVTTGYLAYSGALAKGKLSARTRELIALVVAETNQCDYCVAAHTAIGKSLGLEEDAILQGRGGRSGDRKTQAILEFARSVVADRGQVSDEDLARVREAGATDEEVVEVVGSVALNVLTNYLNHVADTAVDFPAAPELATAS